MTGDEVAAAAEEEGDAAEAEIRPANPLLGEICVADCGEMRRC